MSHWTRGKPCFSSSSHQMQLRRGGQSRVSHGPDPAPYDLPADSHLGGRLSLTGWDWAGLRKPGPTPNTISCIPFSLSPLSVLRFAGTHKFVYFNYKSFFPCILAVFQHSFFSVPSETEEAMCGNVWSDVCLHGCRLNFY